jgi:CRISPR-associated protein Cmr3
MSTSFDKPVDEPLLIDILNLEKYLNGSDSQILVKKQSDFITSEPKIGIGIDRMSNVANSGKLFRIHSNRLSKSEKRLLFHLELNSIELSEEGFINFGGERKVAYFKKTQEHIDIRAPNLEQKKFKIYLSTPAFFQKGWKPQDFFKDYDLTLIAAAIGKPLNVGGWDLERKIPKPMVQCVPAGSVYYVEASNLETAQLASKAIHANSITDNMNDTNYKSMGFGIAYVGKIENYI